MTTVLLMMPKMTKNNQAIQAPSWARTCQWIFGRILSPACPLDTQALLNMMPMLMSGILIIVQQEERGQFNLLKTSAISVPRRESTATPLPALSCLATTSLTGRASSLYSPHPCLYLIIHIPVIILVFPLTLDPLRWTLRCGVWIVFLLALLGNGCVVFVLSCSRNRIDVPR